MVMEVEEGLLQVRVIRCLVQEELVLRWVDLLERQWMAQWVLAEAGVLALMKAGYFPVQPF